MKLSSGSVILLTITWNLRMVIQNISRRVVDNVLNNISPNIFKNMPSFERFNQNEQAAFCRTEL